MTTSLGPFPVQRLIELILQMQKVTSILENDRNMNVYKENRHNQCDISVLQMETLSLPHSISKHLTTHYLLL